MSNGSPSMNRSQTSFPAVNSSHSSCATIEKLGAFGEMRYSNPNPGNLDEQRLRVQLPMRTSDPRQMSMPSAYQQLPQNQPKPDQYRMVPLPVDAAASRGSTATASTQRSGNSGRMMVNLGPQNDQPVYLPTVANSQTDSAERRKIEKLEEVYSTSGDTVEFARNFGEYLNEKIPYGLQIAVIFILCVIALAFLLIGALNIPFCNVQPMIPIWLMISGALFIISASFRIYAAFPTPTRRNRKLNGKNKIGGNVLCHGLEFVFFIVNVVWLILGCVWVYGARPYVHFNEHMFEPHYCQPALYWLAFIACSAYILLFCIIIIAFIAILCIGTFKESNMPEQQDAFIERN